MERLSKEFDIKTKNNNYHLYDIVKKIIKPTSNSEIYKKILKKDRIKEDDEYYITEEQVLKLLSSKRTKACKTAVNILTVISKIEKTDGKYIFCDNEICVINDKKTGKIWFKVNNICDVLGYTALSRSKKIKEHVDDCNKTTLNDFLAPVKKTGVKKTEKCVKESLVDNKMVPYGSLSGNSKSVQMSTIFIDEPGLYSLILECNHFSQYCAQYCEKNYIYQEIKLGTDTNHAVLVVGTLYNTVDNDEYLIIQNSYGEESG